MKGKIQMARVRGTILAGRSGKSGRSQQYRLGNGKGPGRIISTKVMAPEPLPYQTARLAATSRTKTGVSREQELHALKEQARAIKARLRHLEKRIRDIKLGFTPSDFKAFVDPEMCVGRGTCQEVCPAGAISVDEIARVDPKRCIGCGRCVDQCPQGALALHLLNTGYMEQARVAL
jgi:Fe-S-cluster-containing hydrogenase component 2